MSEYSDRIESIRERRAKCYAQEQSLIDCLPRLHQDCFWLLDIVEQYDEFIRDEEEFNERISNIKMEHIMS